jgi:hypothetical protein
MNSDKSIKDNQIEKWGKVTDKYFTEEEKYKANTIHEMKLSLVTENSKS